MRTHERIRSIMRSPKLLWDVLARGRYDFSYDRMPFRARGMAWAKRWGLVRSGLNLLHRRVRPWSWPIHMQFELTNYCSLRCPVCPTGNRSLARRAQSMDAQLLERILAEAGPHLLTASLWGWGEPLMHPQLEQVLRAFSRYPIATLLSTAGQQLDDDRVLEAILAAPPTYLIVALDGLTDETNSLYRVGAKLAPALAGVARLAAAKRARGLSHPVLHMRFMVMKHNQHELPQVRDFAARHGFEFLTLRTLSIVDGANTDAVHGEFVPDQADYRAYSYAEGQRIRRSDFVCEQPFWFPTLLADGTVVSCDQDCHAKLPFGRVEGATTFERVWRGKKAADVRRVIRDAPEKVGFCVNCPFWDRPVTDCSVEAAALLPEYRHPVIIEHDKR
jgi:MoaA/NifB/PqqE/SkfB family radical SAM enzyme